MQRLDLCGHLCKSGPGGYFNTSASQMRFVTVAEMRLLWWGSAREAIEGGMATCRGYIDFLVNDCEIHSSEESDSAFIIRSRDGVWREASFSGAWHGRVFEFDSQQSEYSKEYWIRTVREHIMQAEVRRQSLRLLISKREPIPGDGEANPPQVQNVEKKPTLRRAGKTKQFDASPIDASPQFQQASATVSADGDAHKVEWLNIALHELYPYVKAAIEKEVRENVEPKLKSKLPSILKSFRLRNIDLGEDPPQFGMFRVRMRDRQEYPALELLVPLHWTAGVDIWAGFSGALGNFGLGLKRFTLAAEVSLMLWPLMGELPVVGGMSIAMHSLPSIDWQWDTSLVGGVMQLSHMKKSMESALMALLSDIVLLPNTFYLGWHSSKNIDIAAMRIPRPESILRLGMLEARGVNNSKKMDMSACATVGLCSCRTLVQEDTATPSWEDCGWKDYFVYSTSQLVRVEIFDGEDPVASLEGITVDDVLAGKDYWWPLKDSDLRPCGEIRLACESLRLVTSAMHLENPQPRGSANATALLVVRIRWLSGVPEPYGSLAQVRIIIDDFVQISGPATLWQPGVNVAAWQRAYPDDFDKGATPVVYWHQSFNVLLDKPQEAKLKIQLVMGQEESSSKHVENGSLPESKMKHKKSLFKRDGHDPAVAELQPDFDIQRLLTHEGMLLEQAVPIVLTGSAKQLSKCKPVMSFYVKLLPMTLE